MDRLADRYADSSIDSLAVAAATELVHPLYITDQEAMFELMQKNIALNKANVRAAVYNWGEPTPSDVPKHPDILLAADCVYYEPAFPLLLQTMVDLVGPHTVSYFCFKKRRRADMHFIKAMRKTFVVQEVQDDPDKPVWSRESLFL